MHAEFLMAAGLVLAALVFQVARQKALHRFLQKKQSPSHLPKAVTALVMAAQLSELLKAVEHADIVHISAAVLLLAILVASKSGTQHEQEGS